jgi:hypothetical protein
MNSRLKAKPDEIRTRRVFAPRRVQATRHILTLVSANPIPVHLQDHSTPKSRRLGCRRHCKCFSGGLSPGERSRIRATWQSSLPMSRPNR